MRSIGQRADEEAFEVAVTAACTGGEGDEEKRRETSRIEDGRRGNDLLIIFPGFFLLLLQPRVIKERMWLFCTAGKESTLAGVGTR